jgi:arginine/serine-rich splicing factor 4/5/6
MCFLFISILLTILHSVVEFASNSDLKAAIRKLDDTELSGRRIRLVEDKGRGGGRSSRSSSRSRSKSRSRSRRRDSR